MGGWGNRRAGTGGTPPGNHEPQRFKEPSKDPLGKSSQGTNDLDDLAAPALARRKEKAEYTHSTQNCSRGIPILSAN